MPTEADAEDGSITATAPRVSLAGGPLPLTVPGAVQIREVAIEEDEGDETEVRTLVTLPLPADVAGAPTPAAGVPPAPSLVHEADEPDDSVTALTPSVVSARLPEEDEPRTSPPGRLPPPTPAAGRRPGEDPPAAARSAAEDDEEDAYDAEESVTTRGPVVADYEDDSVTAQAPVTLLTSPTPLALALPPSLLDGGGKAATTRDGGAGKAASLLAGGAGKPPSPRDRAPAARAPLSSETDEGESITAQAPGHLTNMLRVIASPDDAIEGDESADNKTAVMLNAPVKPLHATSASLRAARPVASGAGQSGSARAAAIADLREPSSDSGLRVARAEAPSGDHVSFGAMPAGAMQHHERASGPHPAFGDLRTNRDRSPGAFANTEQAFHASHGPLPHPGAHPHAMRDVDFDGAGKMPRYGLLVGLVAILSFAIPLVLFLWLHQDADDAQPRSATEVSSDLVERKDESRAKAPKGAPPAASSSAPPPSNGGRGHSGPRRR